MATITMRDLLRDSKRVFDALESNRMPVVVTRNGRPFAALMPLDQEQAEALLLASNPEIAEMQKSAERVIASGGGTSLDEALQELESGHAEGGLTEAKSKPLVDVQPKAELIERIAESTDLITETIVKSVTSAVSESEPDAQWAKRIRGLNSSLVEFSFLNELKGLDDVTIRAEYHKRGVRRRKINSSDSLREALAHAQKIVFELNTQALSNARRATPGEIEETIETELRGVATYAKLAGSSTVSQLFEDKYRASARTYGVVNRDAGGRGLLKRR